MNPSSRHSQDMCHETPTIRQRCWFSLLIVAASLQITSGFSVSTSAASSTSRAFIRSPLVVPSRRQTSWPLASFASDSSEYSSKPSDYDEEDNSQVDYDGRRVDGEADIAPTINLKPVPMSKNTGNRFVALVWDQELDTAERDVISLHEDRDALIEDHVMFCRKRNLYNETFNTDSMVDVLHSYHILSSDVQRIVGHAMIMESKELEHVNELLTQEPILNSLTDGEIDNVALYRWRHIRDYTLRQDDGRFGTPAMMIAMDDDGTSKIREETKQTNLEYLISSQRVIAAGPLHVATKTKDDKASVAVGDLIMFNARSRQEAIDFAEDLPSAMEGMYKEIRVHFYNTLDVTGKFVSEDPLRDAPGYQMKEAMEHWGYPVDDEQTPWLNW